MLLLTLILILLLPVLPLPTATAFHKPQTTNHHSGFWFYSGASFPFAHLPSRTAPGSSKHLASNLVYGYFNPSVYPFLLPEHRTAHCPLSPTPHWALGTVEAWSYLVSTRGLAFGREGERKKGPAYPSLKFTFSISSCLLPTTDVAHW